MGDCEPGPGVGVAVDGVACGPFGAGAVARGWVFVECAAVAPADGVRVGVSCLAYFAGDGFVGAGVVCCSGHGHPRDG